MGRSIHLAEALRPLPECSAMRSAQIGLWLRYEARLTHAGAEIRNPTMSDAEHQAACLNDCLSKQRRLIAMHPTAAIWTFPETISQAVAIAAKLNRAGEGRIESRSKASKVHGITPAVAASG